MGLDFLREVKCKLIFKSILNVPVILSWFTQGLLRICWRETSVETPVWVCGLSPSPCISLGPDSGSHIPAYLPKVRWEPGLIEDVSPTCWLPVVLFDINVIPDLRVLGKTCSVHLFLTLKLKTSEQNLFWLHLWLHHWKSLKLIFFFVGFKKLEINYDS